MHSSAGSIVSGFCSWSDGLGNTYDTSCEYIVRPCKFQPDSVTKSLLCSLPGALVGNALPGLHSGDPSLSVFSVVRSCGLSSEVRLGDKGVVPVPVVPEGPAEVYSACPGPS